MTAERRMKPQARSMATWFLYSNTGIAIAGNCWPAPSGGRCRPVLTVQRASRSFWTAFAGCPGQITAAGSPACAASFSARVRRCRAADASVASTICPAHRQIPAAHSAPSKATSRSSIAPAFVRRSRNV